MKIPRAERQRYERFSAYLRTLSEFRYGYEKLLQERKDYHPTSKQFYFNSLTQYVHNIYLTDGCTRFFAWLREYGLSDYVERLEALFGRKIGPSTFMQRLLDFRGKLLVHYDYSGERVRELKKKHDAENSGKEYGTALDELFTLTHQIAIGAAEFIEDLKRADRGKAES